MTQLSPTELSYKDVISPNDHMWRTGSQWYFEIGLSALDCIRRATDAAGLAPRAILDLPCGHGRVCRMLRAYYPQAQLTVCDLDRDGVDFCAAEFDAEALYSDDDLSRVAVGRQFDLIWCGSLFTHLPRDRWPEFLGFFSDRLVPGGVLVFTTHGRQPIQWMHDNFFDYGLTGAEQERMIRGYAYSGFGFISPPNQAFGLSLSSVPFVCGELERFPSLRLIGAHEHGWSGHQDVYACQRLNGPYPTRYTLTA